MWRVLSTNWIRYVGFQILLIGAEKGEHIKSGWVQKAPEVKRWRAKRLRLTWKDSFCHHQTFSVRLSVLTVCKMVRLISYYSFSKKNCVKALTIILTYNFPKAVTTTPTKNHSIPAKWFVYNKTFKLFYSNCSKCIHLELRLLRNRWRNTSIFCYISFKTLLNVPIARIYQSEWHIKKKKIM